MDNFVLNTEYPADKIVWLYEGQMAVSGGWVANTISINHSLGVPLFVRGLFTLDNWVTCYQFGTTVYETQGLVMAISSSLSADTSTVVGKIFVNNSGTCKYHLWGVIDEINTANLSVPETSPSTYNNFILNTTNNLPRLFAEGYATAGTTYNHGLGKVPYVDVWGKNSSNNWALVPMQPFGLSYGTGAKIKVTNNTLEFTNETSPYSEFYYRVYV